jgi:hypothetical protein
MMFLVRSAAVPPPSSVEIKVRRDTPALVPNSAGKTDYFCLGRADDIAALRAQGCEVVELRDGWYADDSGGGIAIWGQGKYWEVRDTPFSVKESGGAATTEATADTAPGDHVNVRRAVFGV